MTEQELKTKANGKLTDFWNALVPRQEAYRLLHDNYFQLVITDPVIDGVDTTWVLRYPHDQKEERKTDIGFSFSSPVPFQISVDEWVGETTGFSATAIVELPDGRRFTRSRSYTDTRKRVRDIVDDTDPFNPVFGDWYLSGADPVIETSAWEEIIEEEI